MAKSRLPKTDIWAYGLLVVLMVLTALQGARLQRYGTLHDELARDTFPDHIEAEAVAVEERALRIPAFVFGETLRSDSVSASGISFVILLDPDNCSNGLAADIGKLGYFHRYPGSWIHSVRGYYVSEQHDLYEQFVSAHRIQFPVVKENPLAVHRDSMHVPTPLVLVLDAVSGTVLDAHHPIPDDVWKSRLFYDKWIRLMNRYSPV